jgi:hypothetical protein
LSKLKGTSFKTELKKRKLTIIHENFSNAIENWEIGELKKQDIRNLTDEEELFASAHYNNARLLT